MPTYINFKSYMKLIGIKYIVLNQLISYNECFLNPKLQKGW